MAASQAKTATGSGVHTSAGEGDASSGGVIVLRRANAGRWVQWKLALVQGVLLEATAQAFMRGVAHPAWAETG